MDPKPEGEAGLSGLPWPPPEHAARVAAYRQNHLIWAGEHERVLLSNDVRMEGQYTTVNIAKNIVTIAADILFGEEIKFTFPDDASDEDAQRVRDIIERNEFTTLLYESALDTGYAGDGVFVVGRDDEEQAIIHTVPAENWFPEQNPDNIREVTKHTLAWERAYGKDKYLRVVEHTPGLVVNGLYQLKGGKLGAPATQDEWARLYGDNVPPEKVETAVEDFLVVHVPNFRTSREYFGQSEYAAGVQSIFGAINARVTQSDGILDRHSDPSMALPYDVWAQATKGGTRDVDPAELSVVALGQNGEKPEYITWDGQLENNYRLIDKLIHLLGVVTETAPQLLHAEGWGGDFSGRALKILLLRTLAKVNRKRLYYDAAIKKILELSQLIEGVDPVPVAIIWPDGLPQDVRETVDIVERRIAGRTLSRKRGIMRMDDSDEKEAGEAIVEIDDEDGRDLERVAAFAPRSGTAKPPIPVRINLGQGGEE